MNEREKMRAREWERKGERERERPDAQILKGWFISRLVME